ncbi:MAG: precorrin-6A reductase [Roseburia sp.]|nr:precorrin-6A reductase [Roseburia sp.]
MKEILIFAGTTEGRRLSELLAEAGLAHTVCVATEYGEIVLTPHPLATVRRGRLNREEIQALLMEKRFCAVVDATHPFARAVTENIQAALAAFGETLPYLRLKRGGASPEETGIDCFETNEACAEALTHTEGNILLTIGSKELSAYCRTEALRQRLYVRVLPSVESLSLCMEQGICGKHIIAMQGPFTAEMNEAVLRQYAISCLVTKESGGAGGYPEKAAAAKRTGARLFVIGRPEEEGCSFSEVCDRLSALCGKTLRTSGRLEVILAGAGMGHTDCMTREVRRAIDEADVVMGAERLLAHLCVKGEKCACYRAEQIISCLRELAEKDPLSRGKRAVVLFSGDSGFYSGCRSVYEALGKEIREGRLNASVQILPGISSVAYLAACVGESWQDAAVYSMHGKAVRNLARRIRTSPKTFLLTSGAADVRRLGEALVEAGLTECEVIAGCQLSYAEQRVERYTPSACRALTKEGLYTCLVKNPHAQQRRLTHGLSDGEFIRDKTPMTKEEAREVSICKLRLREGAVVYDIGSGTGSVAVEIAGLSDDIQVYAVEQKREAALLTARNQEKAGLENITVVAAAAPEGLSGLPPATHAFIGGSGGRLREILAALRQINPRMRVVLNAVSMETIAEIRELLSMEDWIREAEVVQLQVNRGKRAGSHHLMQAENPIWVCAFEFAGEEGASE